MQHKNTRESILYIIIILFDRLPAMQSFFFFFFNVAATPEISPLSLHDALPISAKVRARTRVLIVAQLALGVLYLLGPLPGKLPAITAEAGNHTFVVAYLAVFQLYLRLAVLDRKSTRLNSSHSQNLDAGLLLVKK